MQIIDVEIGAYWPSFNTAAEAIAATSAQPEQAKAKLDSVELSDAVLQGGMFGSSTCVLSFSNGKHLLIEACDFRVCWTVSAGEKPSVQPVPRKLLRHFDSDQHWEFDPNEMISTILGTEFAMLAVTGPSFLVYTRGNSIFWLSAYKDQATGSDLLHACFET